MNQPAAITPAHAAAMFSDLVAAGWLMPAATASEEPLLLTVKAVAGLLACSSDTAAARMRAGTFGPVIYLDSKLRVTREGVAAWIARQGKQGGDGDASAWKRRAGAAVRGEVRGDRPRRVGGSARTRTVSLTPVDNPSTDRNALAG